MQPENEPLSLVERIGAGVAILWMILGVLAVGVAFCGCSSKTRTVDVGGMFTQAELGMLAIGSVEVMSSPSGEESALIRYVEDCALLNSSMMLRNLSIQLTGTNAVQGAEKIASEICRAIVDSALLTNRTAAVEVK